MAVVILLVFLAYTAGISAVQVNNITCEPPVVKEGESANVVCSFSENITGLDHILTHVYHYVERGENAVPMTVFEYHVNGTAHNTTKPGYTLDDPIGTNVTLGITKVTQMNVGTYTCNILVHDVGNLNESPPICTFKISDTRSTEPTVPMSKAMGIGAGAVVGTLFVGLVAGAFGGYCFHKRRTSRRNQYDIPDHSGPIDSIETRDIVIQGRSTYNN